MPRKTVEQSYDKGLENFFVKSMPALPKGLKEFIVAIGPWVGIVAILVSLPWLFVALGMGAVIGPASFMMGWRGGYNYSLLMWMMIILAVLYILALPGLFKRQMAGWKYVYYSVFVKLVFDLLLGSWGALIIGGFLSFYVLFQIKSYYK